MAYISFDGGPSARQEAPDSEKAVCVATICVLAALPMIFAFALTLWG